ncbi:T3SS (YopN, CesT) and YbjN peptide-binding chaperone 1 [Melissospora conviva]|uniref:T3SS (YopN, CesT) and YbjN peptide-binding chaperone 1 n=1 Tax=Melissospora conviva TaxID=3388432 RepID=UPI003B81F61F
MTAAHPSVPADDAPGEPGNEPAPARQAAPAQPESILLDEPSTADLRVKVTEAWQEFARALAACLPNLPVGGRIDLTLDPTASGTDDAVYSIHVEATQEQLLLARAVGNSVLPEGFRLDRSAVADMVALGWSPPGVVTGSAEHFGLLVSAADATRLAATISRTLRDVYGAPHPAFLVYLVRDRADEPIPVGPLGLARADLPHDLDGELDEALAAAVRIAEPEAGDVAELAEAVHTVVSTMMKSNADQVHVDSDGDINIRAGSAMVFVRVRDNPPLVDVFSPVLTQVEPTERLYVKLSELTNRMPIGRLYCTDDTVWASIPVFGRNFQPAHLMLAVQVMTGLADELDDRLHGEFGGKRFFGEEKPVRAEGEHRTGMYL